MTSCLRVLDTFSRPISWAVSRSSDMGLVFNSDKFMGVESVVGWVSGKALLLFLGDAGIVFFSNKGVLGAYGRSPAQKVFKRTKKSY